MHLNSSGSGLLMKCNRFYEWDQKCLWCHGHIVMVHDWRKTPNLPHKYGPYLHPKIEKHVENLPTVTTPFIKESVFRVLGVLSFRCYTGSFRVIGPLVTIHKLILIIIIIIIIIIILIMIMIMMMTIIMTMIISNGNRTEWSPTRSVIIRVINKIGRPCSRSPICLITSMITDRNGRHEVLLPIVPSAVTMYRPEIQTNKLKLTLANSSLLSDFCH